MWGTNTIGRARRRFGRPAPATTNATGLASPANFADEPTDLELRLSRRELDTFVARLDASFGTNGAAPTLDTPGRLATALAQRIEAAGGHGRPTVERSPAGLYTPESWRILVIGADRIARSEVEQLVAAGSRR